MEKKNSKTKKAVKIKRHSNRYHTTLGEGQGVELPENISEMFEKPGSNP
jgi:hypothetical protein